MKNAIKNAKVARRAVKFFKALGLTKKQIELVSARDELATVIVPGKRRAVVHYLREMMSARPIRPEWAEYERGEATYLKLPNGHYMSIGQATKGSVHITMYAC